MKRISPNIYYRPIGDAQYACPFQYFEGKPRDHEAQLQDTFNESAEPYKISKADFLFSEFCKTHCPKVTTQLLVGREVKTATICPRSCFNNFCWSDLTEEIIYMNLNYKPGIPFTLQAKFINGTVKKR